MRSNQKHSRHLALAKVAISIASAVGMPIVIAIFALHAESAVPVALAAPASAKQQISPLLKANEELNLSQQVDNMHCEVRVCDEFVCTTLAEMNVIVLAQSPDWRLKLINPRKKAFCEVSLLEWLRRGSPQNFMRVTALPTWPLIYTNSSKFLNLPVRIYALPYLTKNHQIVSSRQGKAGSMLVLQPPLPQPVVQIVSTLYQIPRAETGFPLQISIWDPDKSGDKYSSGFLFSGVRSDKWCVLRTSKATIVQKHSLPSTAGYTIARNANQIWSDNAETESLFQLMK